MKKKLLIIALIAVILFLLCTSFDKYIFYINEPFNFSDSINSREDISYVQNKYSDDTKYSIYSLQIKNTLLNTIFYGLFSKNSINISKYPNNYILKVNNITNNVEKKLFWDEKKYGEIKNAVINSYGDIFVSSDKKSEDLSTILEENIVMYKNGKILGELVYSIKHTSFVNDFNKKIQEIDILNGSLVWAEYDGNYLDINTYDMDKKANTQKINIKSSEGKRLDDIVLMEDCCYISFSDNRMYKISYDKNEAELKKAFNSEKLSLYKMYKYNDDKIILRMHKSFGEELKIYDGNSDNNGGADSFETLNLNGLPADAYLKTNFINNLNDFNFEFEPFKVLVMAAYILIAVLIIILLRYIYIYILNKKIYITFKLVMCILPILIIGNYFIASFSAVNSYKIVEKELFMSKIKCFDDYAEAKNKKIASEYGSASYFGELISRIQPYKDIDESVIKEIYSIMEYSFAEGSYDTEGWYWSIDAVNDGCMYKIVDSELNDTVFFSRYASGENKIADDVIKGEKYTTIDFDDKYIFGLYPIKGGNGNVTGMMQIGTYYYGFKNNLYNKFFYENSKRISVMTGILLAVLIFITLKSLLPLLKLARKIENVSIDRIEEVEEMKTNDEVQILTHAFNSMAKNINQNMDKMMELNDSYYRFVPLELIRLLGKSDIKDVNLGDNINRDIAILCVGINEFYNVMMNNQTGKIFSIMSNIYEHIGPIIRKHGGVVDRFIDKGLIAMFDKSADGAVKSAEEIVKTVRELNISQNKFAGINLSCAITAGEVTFGILGEEKRLQNTTISYTTNYAVILQENSSKLSSNIVISEAAFIKTDENLRRLSRYLGKIKIELVGETLDLYDIYESDGSNIISMKNLNKSDFENSVKSYGEGEYYLARQGFVKVLDRNIEEEIAREYFYQTEGKLNADNCEDIDKGVLII